MVETKILIKKLIKISAALDYLQKDKVNKMQGYNYLSEAKVKEVMSKEFGKHGIAFNYSTEEVREYEISPTHKGTRQFVTIAKGNYHFMDSESDVDVSGTWFGSGTDTGDKGLYKAITGGIKYVLSTNFLIPTGDDPEKDDEDDKGTGNKPDKKTNKKPEKDIQKEEDGALKKALMEKHKGDKDKAKAEYDKLKSEEAEIEADLEKDIEEHLAQVESGAEDEYL